MDAVDETERSLIRIEMDLFRDLVENVRAKLVAAGYAVPPAYTPRDVLYAWANVRRRIPATRPRRVQRSREFRCPPQHAQGLTVVERKLANGESLRPHLSRRVFRLDYNDALLNDWEIQHLHLGTRVKKNGMVAGTREIVFCILEPDDAYFIQIMDHNSFSEPDLLDIVHANWPQLLQQLPLVVGQQRGLGARHGASEIQEMRNARVLSIGVVLTDGTVVAPRGGGYSTTGHSIKAMVTARHWTSMTEQWEQLVHGAIEELIKDARQRDIDIPPVIHFELQEDNGTWFALAPVIRTRIRLPI
jgi:hypothetical protein